MAGGLGTPMINKMTIEMSITINKPMLVFFKIRKVFFTAILLFLSNVMRHLRSISFDMKALKFGNTRLI
ncbi:hypothetical protein GCM10022260_23680 [Gaetbulibacter aestuarii]